jgi:hypothetical protein
MTSSKRPNGALASSKGVAEADGSKQVGALYTKYHRGQRELALRQLAALAEEHPSGLASLALTKLLVLDGFRAALRVRAV